MTLPISSGFVRGGANANRDWYKKLPGAIDKFVASVEVESIPALHPMEKVSPTDIGLPSMPTMGRDQARQSGYTGDQCTRCNSMRMKISGHCMVCESCGETTGCS